MSFQQFKMERVHEARRIVINKNLFSKSLVELAQRVLDQHGG